MPPAPPRGSRIVQSASTVPVARRDEIVLVDMRGGRRITLDRFGRRVWAQLADRPTLPLLVEQLRDGGDGGDHADQLTERVTGLLAYWSERGVIVWR